MQEQNADWKKVSEPVRVRARSHVLSGPRFAVAILRAVCELNSELDRTDFAELTFRLKSDGNEVQVALYMTPTEAGSMELVLAREPGDWEELFRRGGLPEFIDLELYHSAIVSALKREAALALKEAAGNVKEQRAVLQDAGGPSATY